MGGAENFRKSQKGELSSNTSAPANALPCPPRPAGNARGAVPAISEDKAEDFLVSLRHAHFPCSLAVLFFFTRVSLPGLFVLVRLRLLCLGVCRTAATRGRCAFGDTAASPSPALIKYLPLQRAPAVFDPSPRPDHHRHSNRHVYDAADAGLASHRGWGCSAHYAPKPPRTAASSSTLTSAEQRPSRAAVGFPQVSARAVDRVAAPSRTPSRQDESSSAGWAAHAWRSGRNGPRRTGACRHGTRSGSGTS